MLNPISALAIAVFAVGVDAYIVAGMVPVMAEDLAEPVAAVGLVASAYALPTALLAPVFGPFSDRRGRRLALLLGLGVFVLSAAACAVSPDLPVLLMARAVNGLGAAIILPAAFAYAGDRPDSRDRDRAMGLLASAFPLATILGLPLGSFAATLAGWRGAFVFVTLVGLAALLAVRALCPPDRARSITPMGYLGSYRAIVSDRSALALLAVTFLWFIAPMGLFVFLADFVHETYAVPSAQAGLSLVVVGVVGVAASRLSGRVMGRVGPRIAVLVAMAAFGSAALLMPMATLFPLPELRLPLSLLVLALWASGTWFGVPAMQAIVAAHSERLRGTMLAFNSSAFNLSGVVGPVVIGSIVAAAGYGAAFASGALFAALAFGLAWAILPRRAAPQPAAAVA